MKVNLKASEPKWVNSILNIIGVNSLRLEGLHMIYKRYILTQGVSTVALTYFFGG